MSRHERRRQQRQLQKDTAQIMKESRTQPVDLKRLGMNSVQAYNNGLHDGIERVSHAMQEIYIASALLTAHELYGFGRDRCHRMIRQMCIYALNLSDELEDAVRLRCHIDLDFTDHSNVKAHKMSHKEWKEWCDKYDRGEMFE